MSKETLYAKHMVALSALEAAQALHEQVLQNAWEYEEKRDQADYILDRARQDFLDRKDQIREEAYYAAMEESRKAWEEWHEVTDPTWKLVEDAREREFQTRHAYLT